jgi:hypothetical protein
MDAQRRADHLNERLANLRGKGVPTWTFVPSPECADIGYFSESIDVDLAAIPVASYVPARFSPRDVDLVVATSHGADVATGIEALSRHFPHALIALWLWDNHISRINNRRSVGSADVFFPSHLYAADYLRNSVSALGCHAPACVAQWSAAEATVQLATGTAGARLHQALLNYVNYSFGPRSHLLADLGRTSRLVALMTMPASDRSRYFSKSRTERLREWLAYKSTIVLPMHHDLSTRVFDALLAGLTLVVPSNIYDFDAVVPADLQGELGIVRVDELTTPALLDGLSIALLTFDAMGEAGVRARQRFVLSGHMLHHRLARIVSTLIGSGLAGTKVLVEHTLHGGPVLVLR